MGGGIDCEDAAPLENRLRRFKPEHYRFGSLVYAGNKYLAAAFLELCPEATVIRQSAFGSAFEQNEQRLRSGAPRLPRRSRLQRGRERTQEQSEWEYGRLPKSSTAGFQRAVLNHSSIQIVGACILLDIGGATTDVHYTRGDHSRRK